MRLQIRKEEVEGATMMIMRDHPPRDAPEPFNTVGVRIIGRGVDQAQMLFEFGQHTAHEERASRGMGLEIVGNHDGDASSLLRTSHSATHLLTENISSAPCGNAAIKPTITPVQQAKAIDFPIIPRCFNQALPASSFLRPDARESGVKGHLHLVLQIQVSLWQQGKQISQVVGKLIPKVSLNQIMNG